MHRAFSRCATLLLSGVVLAAGCSTTTRQELAAARAERAEEAELERRADAQAHFASGVILMLQEQPAAAYEEFYRAASSNPQDAELLEEVASRLLEGRQYPRALEVLKWAAALPDAPGLVFVRLGFVYAQLGQNKHAIQASRQAVNKLPLALPVRQNLYLSYLQAKQPDAALKVLNEAAAEPGTDAEFLINLAELYINHGRQFPERRTQVNGQALSVLNRAGRLAPPGTGLKLKLADELTVVGDGEGAAKIYQGIIEDDNPPLPLREMLRAKLVDAYLRAGNSAKATQQLNAMLVDNPGNASAWYFLGSIAFDERRWDDAIANFRKALQFNSSFEQAYYDLASAQLSAGQGAEAVTTMQRARKRFPDKFAAEYLLGLAYHGQKQYAEALQHLVAAEAIARKTETNRLSTGLYFQLGASSERSGDLAKAEQYFEKSIALSPTNSEALNYLGFMWADQGQHLERAKGLIERAVKLEPDNAAFLDSLGWVYYRLGKPREAVVHLLKAVAASRDEPDATIYDHLGDAYAALKEMDKAREAWAKSLSLAASDAVKRKLDNAN